MCPVNSDDNDDVFVKGGTDSTRVGNVADRMKVDATGTVTISGSAQEVEHPTFVCCVQSIQIGSNKSMYSLVNTTGSTVKIRIREIRLINVQSTAVTGLVANFQLLRCTGHSAGTTTTCLPHDSTDSLSSNVTSRTGATISGESSDCLRRWGWSTDEWAQGAQDVESQDHSTQLLLRAYDVVSKSKPITLNANEGITLKQTVNSTVGTFDVVVVFTQE